MPQRLREPSRLRIGIFYFLRKVFSTVIWRSA